MEVIRSSQFLQSLTAPFTPPQSIVYPIGCLEPSNRSRAPENLEQHRGSSKADVDEFSLFDLLNVDHENNRPLQALEPAHSIEDQLPLFCPSQDALVTADFAVVHQRVSIYAAPSQYGHVARRHPLPVDDVADRALHLAEHVLVTTDSDPVDGLSFGSHAASCFALVPRLCAKVDCLGIAQVLLQVVAGFGDLPGPAAGMTIDLLIVIVEDIEVAGLSVAEA